jgi:hypothetical protein
MEIPVLLADSSWTELRQARLGGLRIHYREILSEESEESLELNQIGYLLAATGNDAYNALVCTQFTGDLSGTTSSSSPWRRHRRKTPGACPPTHRGRVAFEEGAGLEELLGRYYRCWRFKKTRLTDAFTYEDLGLRIGNEAMRILVLRENGEVEFEVPSDRLEPDPGDTVVTYGPIEERAPSGRAPWSL